MAIKVYVRKKADRTDLLLYFIDPFTKREVSRTAGTADPREAERAAAMWERELLDYRGSENDGWKYFRDRFREEHLASLSDASMRSFGTALNHFQRVMSPQRLADVTPNTISVYQAKLFSEGRKATSIINYLKHLKTALNWAAEVGILDRAPKVKLPRQAKRVFMRARPVTEAEYRLMLEAATAAGPEWPRLLELLWLSGLRLSEAVKLSWDRQPIVVSMERKPHPQILYFAEGHKARRDDAVPMTPDLFAWLDKTPQRDRWGLVVKLPLKSLRKIMEQVSGFGEAAGAVVNDDGKFASAHDLRRSFGTRWAQKVMPMTLQKLMRHADIQTTLRYYVGLSSTDAGRELWGGTEQPHVPKNVPKTTRKRSKAG